MPPWLRPLPQGAQRATLEQADPHVIALVRDCSARNQWPLYLWGETGVGKTCAAAVAYTMWKQSAMWMSLTELCDLLNAFNTAPVQLLQVRRVSIEITRSGLWNRIRKMGLMVIDEIGTRDASPHRYDALLRLLDTRNGLPLILTGNIEPGEALARIYDERVQSRIAAGVIVRVTGNDRRMEGIASRITEA